MTQIAKVPEGRSGIKTWRVRYGIARRLRTFPGTLVSCESGLARKGDSGAEGKIAGIAELPAIHWESRDWIIGPPSVVK